MERKIVFSAEVEIYLKNLIDILFDKNYFGFKEDARKYVHEIVKFIMHNDFKINVRETPKTFQKFGKKFIQYKANHRTSWFIFYDQKDNQFLINHIINNHSQEFPELM